MSSRRAFRSNCGSSGSKSAMVFPETGAARMGFRPGVPVNCDAEPFLMMSTQDQTKLVRKPPQSTITSTGRFCSTSECPAAIRRALVRSPMGLPASRPKAKKLLMKPARIAMARPLPKLKSFSPASAFSSGVNSRSLETPAAPLTAHADDADGHTQQDDLA